MTRQELQALFPKGAEVVLSKLGRRLSLFRRPDEVVGIVTGHAISAMDCNGDPCLWVVLTGRRVACSFHHGFWRLAFPSEPEYTI